MIYIREKNYENKIKEFLHSLGIYQAGTPKQKKTKEQIGWFFKMWGGGMSQSGIPDLICCIKGKFVAIEVKGDGGRPSKLQEINISEINKSGGLGIIPYPDNFGELKKLILEVING